MATPTATPTPSHTPHSSPSIPQAFTQRRTSIRQPARPSTAPYLTHAPILGATPLSQLRPRSSQQLRKSTSSIHPVHPMQPITPPFPTPNPNQQQGESFPLSPISPQPISRWRASLAHLRAAISNPAPEDPGLYSSADSLPSRWEDADDALFLSALTHNGVGAGLPGQREADALAEAERGGGEEGEGCPYTGRWRGKVYQSSTDSVDEIVVDGFLSRPHPRPHAHALPQSQSESSEPEPLFYPPSLREPPSRAPPNSFPALVWYILGLGGGVGWCRRRVWPAVGRFFDLSFWSDAQEESYRRDWWYTSKQLAFTASLFYILNTILAISLIPRPLNLYNKITYFGIAPLVTVPITMMVLFNAPRFRWRHNWQIVYQPVLCMATWCWAWFSIWDMWACGYYQTVDHPMCGNKDFLSTFYFATALPVLALFALGQHRLYASLGAIAYFVLMCVLILPDRSSWVRNVLNFIVFQAFLIYVHYMREQAERRIFILREQLKAQFKVTEKAQDLERRASDSKKRFVSYIFHEVRVPLNTALLAVQNLAPDVLSWRGKDDIEFGALEGSLNMMSKVLNDVLDFNRMDSGRFESTSSPFCFHNVIRTMLIPLELAAQARGLSVTTQLDTAIDSEANRAAAAECESGADALPVQGEGWVLGDEMRLRQLVTNLTSNACKFTPSGGRVCVRTTLIKRWEGPCASEDGKPRNSSASELSDPGGESGSDQSPCRWRGRPAGRDSIVVRIEVEDTGVGIRPRDIMANQLFSPYVQTEIGRYQGGKGTGLGLALVRHIVKLSGGRLGVRSKVGKGSTFWVELALGVGKEAVAPVTERQRLVSEDLPLAPSASGFEEEVPPPLLMNGTGGTGTMFTAMSNVGGMRIPLPQTGVIDARAVEGATPSTQASTGSKGYLDTPLSDDSAMKTILEHDGMVELTSRRLAPAPVPASSPTGTVRSDPSPNLAETLSTQSFAPLLPPVPPEETTAKYSPNRGVLAAALLPTPRDSPTDVPATNPVRAPAPSPAPAVPAEEPLPVLVVDDDNLTRRLMARMLSRMGCTADTAEDGSVALKMLLGETAAARALSSDPFYAGAVIPPLSNGQNQDEPTDEHKYGIVFLDNQMPFYSGVQVVYKLRELGRHTFVVGVTGNALAEDQQEYLDAGVDRVLTKPVMEKDLRAMVTLARSVRKKKRAIPPPAALLTPLPPSKSSATSRSDLTARP
ncbi:hypothetical protein DACRYDRAFT_119345 [Dacryopinax primogenitus]|uniref:histidine kinase n=1 Tax=Dacryopinax primogenitus (strain DJM 731) TaxID=1858805 RepID=M5FRQ4_DACPD|nr:uncharacterized protein DACRYDRAFT_119345 [Dacryopinax primogenitus]EJT97684.1 hypothetical protein DACRYDRAFT_119345 [Dacryopinax primogenitus]